MSEQVVSVILPCYNAGDYVVEAMESILRQSYGHLEVVAIDDGSTDETLSLLERAARADPRVRVIVNPENLGLIRTLNRGVEEARGAYIARMDADDVSAPDRIERQVALLRTRPDVGVVSTGAEYIDTDGDRVGLLPVRCTEPDSARFLACFATPLVHAAIVARVDVMLRHPYRFADRTLHTEDYELFTRMISDGISFANIDLPLYRIRIHAGSVSRRHEEIQIENFVNCAKHHLESVLGTELPPGEHRALVNRIDGSVSGSELHRALRRLHALRSEYLKRPGLSGAAAREVGSIADEQRVDILLQAILKGTIAQRAAAILLSVRYLPGLLSSPSLTYLRAKVGSKRPRLQV